MTTFAKSPTPTAAAAALKAGTVLNSSDTFVHRHVAPSEADISEMLESIGYRSLDELMRATVPADIRLPKPLVLTGEADHPLGEAEMLTSFLAMAAQNQVFRSCIGMGYYDCINILWIHLNRKKRFLLQKNSII